MKAETLYSREDVAKCAYRHFLTIIEEHRVLEERFESACSQLRDRAEDIINKDARIDELEAQVANEREGKFEWARDYQTLHARLVEVVENPPANRGIRHGESPAQAEARENKADDDTCEEIATVLRAIYCQPDNIIEYLFPGKPRAHVSEYHDLSHQPGEFWLKLDTTNRRRLLRWVRHQRA